MSITPGVCTSYKKELLDGLHQGSASGAAGSVDTFKMALYTNAATMDRTQTAYTATNEVSNSGTGYTTGGATIGSVTVGTLGIWAFINFTDVVFSGVTLTTRGAMIYNFTRANKAVGLLEFGADKSPSNADFTVDLGNANSGAVTNINFANADNSINRTDAGSFITDGFKVGHQIITDDSTNPGPWAISSVTAAKIIVTGGSAIQTVSNAVKTVREAQFVF